MPLSAFTFTDRALPFVELGIGDSRIAGTARWDRARWDQGRWSGTDADWLDISCEVRTARFEYGRRAVTDRFVPGAATIVVDNASGWADPNVAEQPGVLTMRPGRPIRVGVDHATLGRRILWHGFVDTMTPVYLPTRSDAVELSCIDALGEVNRAKFAPLAEPVGANEPASTRINRILNLAMWPDAKRSIQASSEPLVASAIGGQAADLLGQAADSDGGAVFGDRAGNVAFRARDWQMFPPTKPVDGVIGNVEPTDVCPVAWERPFARADIATRVIIGRSLETAYVIDDLAGWSKYGIEPFERVDLLTANDSRIVALGQRILQTRSSSTAPRIRTVTLDARTSAGALDVMTLADPYAPTRYRCRLRYPRGTVFDAEHLTTAVVHEMTPTSWSLLMSLDLAAPYAAAGGRWDSARWDRSTWN